MRISDWSSDVCSSDLLAAHCTRITAAARLASFLVFGQLVEATLLGVLVDFGATNLASADDEKYSRFLAAFQRSEEHTSELQSLMRISYAVFCLKKNSTYNTHIIHKTHITQLKHPPTHSTPSTT